MVVLWLSLNTEIASNLCYLTKLSRRHSCVVQSSYRYGCPYLKITFQKHYPYRSLKITLHGPGNLSLSSIQKWTTLSLVSDLSFVRKLKFVWLSGEKKYGLESAIGCRFIGKPTRIGDRLPVHRQTNIHEKKKKKIQLRLKYSVYIIIIRSNYRIQSAYAVTQLFIADLSVF